MLSGVTFWYLLTGRTPFAGRSIEELRARQAEPLPLKQLKNAHVPLECVTVLESMLGSRSGEATAKCARATEKGSPVLSPF